MKKKKPSPSGETMKALQIIEDEKQIYKSLKNLLAEQSKIAISIFDVPDENKTQIEEAVQELLSAEVVKQIQDQLRASGVSNEFLDESDLRSSLEGLPLPDRDLRIIEAKVRRLAMTMRQPHNGGDRPLHVEDPENANRRPPTRRPPTGTITQASHSSDHICICMATGFPGETTSLSTLNPLPVPPPDRNFLIIAVFFPASGLFRPTDGLRLIVEPGAPFGIGPDQMQVGLASQVSWAKEIVAWNLCKGRLGSVFQGGPNTTPTFMLLERGCDRADTIVFRKPGFLGVWYDLANFDFTLFWTVFGGRRLTFTWLFD